ncbi:MAG: class I SAM-dependent methyltransferase [Gammaproteobacteria bacterium]
MSSTAIVLTPEIYQYYQTHTLRPHQVLDALRQETLRMPMAEAQICPEQGAFMQMLVKMLGARKVIELGVFTGYSALSVALALPEDGKLIACDINAEWTNIAQRYWQEAGVAHKIDLRLAPAMETLQRLLDAGEANTFDFIFIDADKENYLNYYEAALKLIRVGGVIAIDNVLWYGQVVDSGNNAPSTQAIRQINSHILTDQRVDLSMLPIGDGLTLAMKRK